MTFDLNTEEGLDNAAAWVNRLLPMISENGRWVIPRSGTVVTVLSHDDKHVSVSSLEGEPGLKLVLDRAGWTVIDIILNSQND